MSEVRQRKTDEGKSKKASEEGTKPDNARQPQLSAEERGVLYEAKKRIWGILIVLVVGSAVVLRPTLKRFLYGREQDPLWWRKTIIYQVYPRSFQDSNGDGVGDLKGITTRLDHFVFLGIGAIWLSPFYSSPMADFGYDVSNFTNVDPIFGTLKDFDQLVETAHKKGIHVIVDFIPNHTSDKHKWFQESRKGGKSNPYKDYYVWHPGKLGEGGRRQPPSNWVSVFGGPMWEFDPQRKEYYLHQFTKEQPDLNFRNEKVQEEMKAALQFWLDRGVDGFRVDAIRHMFEIPDLTKDEPTRAEAGKPCDVPGCDIPFNYYHYLHPYTVNLPEVHQILKSWRRLFDEHRQNTGKYVYMVSEVYPDEGSKDIMEYYHSGSDMPFNFNLMSMNRSCGGWCVRHLVEDWLDNMPKGKWPNWVTGNHDQPRITGKLGTRLVNAMNMLLLLLPGTPTTYQGEEIGMLPISLSYEQTVDPQGRNMGPERYAEFSRDPCRSPMQWNSRKNAGFSEADTTWLPVHPDYKKINVKVQKQDTTEKSPLLFYRALSQLRQDLTLQWGMFDFAITTTNIFSFIRFREGKPAYLIAVNFGDRTVETNFQAYRGVFPPQGKFITETGFVVMNTALSKTSKVHDRTFVQMNKISLEPYEGAVFRFWPGS